MSSGLPAQLLLNPSFTSEHNLTPRQFEATYEAFLERIHPATMAAEGPLHELGAIAIVKGLLPSVEAAPKTATPLTKETSA